MFIVQLRRVTVGDPEIGGRVERERIASNEGQVYKRNAELRSRFSHVHTCPNSVYAQQRQVRMIAAAVRGRRVLDFGCGNGHLGPQLLAAGATSVHGIDISERLIADARTRIHNEPRLTYEVTDAATFKGKRFDVVVGSAILHHLDWRPALENLFANVLEPGGVMFFSEPLGSGLGLKLYWRHFPNAHTADERPFLRKDIKWLHDRFPGFQFHVSNYVSLYAGLLSSLVFSASDNFLMRASDRVDRVLERIEFLKPAFRHALFVIQKPA